MTKTPIQTAENELVDMLRRSRVPRVRSIRQFAEDEIWIPDGPWQGYRFKADRQPFNGLYFDEVDSGRWSRFVVTGDQQSGKSTIGFALMILYHLFELRETVVVGVHDDYMASDKWQNVLLPMIRRTRYEKYLPKSGGGSRGGKTLKVMFTNGVTLRFMTAGGSDKGRAAFTTRVMAATEIDGMDQSGGTSREADKLTQIEGRTSAFENSRVYLECTVSIAEGRTWREYTGGSESRIVCPCPHCGDFVTIEREHLHGWQNADDEDEVRCEAHFKCPACEERIDEDQRRDMNHAAKLVHRGQSIDSDGNVCGDLPRTRTLGFRWTCFNNLFKTIERISVAEWRASQDPDEENAEKSMSQFWWATPYVPSERSFEPMTIHGIASRQRRIARGLAPNETEHITVGIDLGAHLCYWVSTAWLPDGTPHVVDYGYITVPSRDFALEVALPSALREFRDDILIAGWPRHGGEEGEMIVPSLAIVDAGNWQDMALDFAAEAQGIMGSKGRGAGQWKSSIYRAPKTTNSNILHIGDSYHIAAIVSNGKRRRLVEIDVDRWKMWAHLRFQTDVGKPGGITLPAVAKVREHMTFAKQILGEKWDDESGKWEKVGQNHFLDSLVLAGVAGHLAGVRLDGGKEDKREHPKKGRSRRTNKSRPDAWLPTPIGLTP